MSGSRDRDRLGGAAGTSDRIVPAGTLCRFDGTV